MWTQNRMSCKGLDEIDQNAISVFCMSVNSVYDNVLCIADTRWMSIELINKWMNVKWSSPKGTC